MVINMRKILLFLILVMACQFAEARYVRQLKEPDFFIPETDKMHKVEKLPDSKKFIEYDRKINMPDYKKKYDVYLSNLKKFADSGELVLDDNIAVDIAKMTTGEVFVIEAETLPHINTQEQREFYLLVDKLSEN